MNPIDRNSWAPELRGLMKKTGLRQSNVAALLEVSDSTVSRWLADPDSDSYRKMPKRMYRLLVAELETRRRRGLTTGKE